MRISGILLLAALCHAAYILPAHGQMGDSNIVSRLADEPESVRTGNPAGSESGAISGVVVDGETGETLIAVNIILQGTQFGVASDLSGSYRFQKVPAGTHTLIASSIGYAKQIIKDVHVRPGEAIKLDLKLMPDVYELEEVVVEARALRNTDAFLLKERQQLNSVSDAISAEAITRTGSGDAASAMSHVTGASVVGGKYVYVRGLGDRYSSTQLNGVELPSADPDKKAFNLDLFPTALLDNIVTLKTFTPDKPGNFSGGLVDIRTKAFPDRMKFSISGSSGYNSQTTGNGNFLTYDGGKTDWLGMDDGSRSLPGILADPTMKIPTQNEARRNSEAAYLLDAATNSFTSKMAPAAKTAPLNQSFSLSFGDQEKLFGNPLGFQTSVSYSRTMSSYEGGAIGRWQLQGNAAEIGALDSDLLLTDARASDEASWGGLANLAYKLAQNHQVSANVIYTQSGESIARYQSGEWYSELGSAPVYETRSLLYTERNVQSYQLAGEHRFPSAGDVALDWNASLSKNSQDEPDLRFFSSDFLVEGADTLYSIRNNNYNWPTRFYRHLEERSNSVDAAISIPFAQWDGLTGKLKAGGSFQQKDRTFTERRFEYQESPVSTYAGDPYAYFNENAGIIDSTGTGRYTIGTFIVDQSRPAGNYAGSETIGAGFAMVELPLSQNLTFAGGARLETTDMNVASQDTSLAPGVLDNLDVLPSTNFIYRLEEHTNVRLAYGRTLARPNFRELAPYRNFEFLGDFLFAGNAELNRTLIDNFDIRVERFLNPGEIIAISGFYKQFDSPIERTIDIETNNISYKNVDRGVVYGIELEARKNLGDMVQAMKHFQVAANLSIVHSSVDIPANELELIKRFDPAAESTRPLFGQSPYIVNVEFSYVNPDAGTTAGIYLNMFGDRLSEVTLGATPDVYERARATVDLVASQQVWKGLSIKASAKNLLDSGVRKSIEYKGTDYVYSGYNLGRTFTFGFSYSL